MKYYKKLLPLLLSISVLVSGCTGGTNGVNSAELFAMDTVINVTINDKNSKELLKNTEKIITEEEKLLSKTIAASDISKLNSKRSLPLESLSKSTKNVIEAGIKISQETYGCFDMSLGVLSDLWGFGTENPAVPADDDITASLKKSGYKNIDMTDIDVTLQNDVELDLGGIAKGYVTDLIVDEYRKNDVCSAMLSLGGNVYVLGDNNGKAWRVGIANPKNPGELCGVLSLKNKAVVTSGDYQRYFEQDGQRYHHIIDPATGFPAESDLSGVTVVADSATVADGYSTALFVVGYEKSVEFLASKNDIGAVFVKKDGEVICTENIKSAFEEK